MKICKKCGELKFLNLFAKQKEKKDGHHSTCKKCRSQYDKARYDSKARSELYKLNLKVERQKRREYYQENKIEYYANKAKRRAAVLQRTPKWLNSCHFMVMRSYYAEAKHLREKGFDCEVDHIVPLQGKNVSGLHVPWNLQVIEKTKNRSKGNKF